jgi:hypothetical protein
VLPPVSPSAGTTSLPAAALDQLHLVKPASFGGQETSSSRTHPLLFCQLLTPTKCSQFQIHCLQMSKNFASKISLHFENQDVKPTPTLGVEQYIHTSRHPPVFAKSLRLDPEKLEITKA